MDSCCLEGGRTVVVSGVPDVLPVSRMIDKLTIHFQRYKRSHGGDVEVVRYPTNMAGVAFVTFDNAEGKVAGCSLAKHKLQANHNSVCLVSVKLSPL